MMLPVPVAFAATETSPATTDESSGPTIHYYDSAGWSEPFAYVYGDDVHSASWPGVRMVDEGEGWYRVTVDATHGLRVLFSGYRPIQGGENKFTEDLYDFKVLEVVFPDTPITKKVAETLRVLHDTHASLSVHAVQVVFKITK